MSKQYKVIGLGGTFDHFHKGHRVFLEFAAGLADELWVGVTTNELVVGKILSEEIESFEVRKKEVENFLQSLGVRYMVFALHDPYGVTIEKNEVEAVAVTTATYTGGVRINEKRAKLGLTQLPLHTCELVHDELGEDFISSSRIRAGEIDREGKVFAQVFEKDVVLNDAQRTFFQKPQGEIITQPLSGAQRKYVVGDIALETFIKNKWSYTFGVFDLQTQRKSYVSQTLQLIKEDTLIYQSENQAGVISVKMVETLKKAIQITGNILIQGEEDLAAVALVILAPLGSAIYYGQPGKGIVEMIVTEELKRKFYEVLTQ